MHHALATKLVAAMLAVAATHTVAAAEPMMNTGAGDYRMQVTSLRDMPFRTVVRQQYDYSCGSAALATLLRHHYGRTVDEAQVFKAMYARGDQTKIRQVGFSLLDMKGYLKDIGLNSDGYRETLADLQTSDAPAIAVINVGNYRHFVVVKGVQAGRILIGDPAQGIKTYTLQDFAKIWNGVLFVIHRDDEAGAFNRTEEWGLAPRAPSAPLSDSTLATLTRELSPIYQIRPVRMAGR